MKKRRPGVPISFTEPELEGLNMGIAMVTPVDDILDALNWPELVATRDRWDSQRGASSVTAKEDGGADGSTR